MLFVIHATDRPGGMATRAKFYRAHRIHLDQSDSYDVDVVTAGTLLADDGETPVGSIFVIDAKDRAAAGRSTAATLTRSTASGEGSNSRLNKKRGTPIPSRRNP